MATFLTADGWLTRNERLALREYAMIVGLRNATPDESVIVDIGVEYGASMVCLRAGWPYRIYGVDLDNSKAAQGIKNDQGTVLLTGDSGTLGLQWTQGQNISLLFIDGDHSYNGVMRDTVWCDHVQKYGIVIFHDCYEWDAPPKTVRSVCPEVTAAVDAWYAAHQNEYTEVTCVDSMRIFIKTK